MLEWLGMEGLGWLVAVTMLVVGAIFMAVSRRKAARAAGGERYAAFEGGDRISVLESATVDAERRIVLVRCDDVEHLIMVGGPADVVIESDVRRSRPPGGYAPESGLRIALNELQPALKIESRLAEPAWEEAWPSAAESAGDSGDADQPMPRTAPFPAGPPAAPAAKAQSRSEIRETRRDLPPEPRARPMPQAQPISPLRGSALQAGPSRRARGGEEPGVSERTQSARDPEWQEADGIDSEIAAAVQAETRSRTSRFANEAFPLPGSSGDRDESETAFADLADRLEEALAREVQSANPPRGRPRSDPNDFGFERAANDQQRPSQVPAAEPRNRSEERTSAKRLNAAPEPEARREGRKPPDRQDDAPVISLNARRREASDPLEDEMARLLGELTGDTNRR